MQERPKIEEWTTDKYYRTGFGCEGRYRLKKVCDYALELEARVERLEEALGNLNAAVNAIRNDLGTQYPTLAEAWVKAEQALKE